MRAATCTHRVFMGAATCTCTQSVHESSYMYMYTQSVHESSYMHMYMYTECSWEQLHVHVHRVFMRAATCTHRVFMRAATCTCTLQARSQGGANGCNCTPPLDARSALQAMNIIHFIVQSTHTLYINKNCHVHDRVHVRALVRDQFGLWLDPFCPRSTSKKDILIKMCAYTQYG